ncbi:helix-turn-helix domain-containing protein [Streptomyces sp. NBC_01136]|uniref:helix-turn-helix domain-containing protein n=1 Tax=unclassified Streptomyces TaxID=2593676 RepID=UPI00324C6B98|nr:helix-turn-helix domain-containing protein [Streptomyces sp. NBC_01136]
MGEPRSAPTVLQIVLGRRLTQLRVAAGLTAQEAAKRLRMAHTTITRIERAETSLKWATGNALLEIYEVSEAEIAEFLDLTEKANRPGWWQGFRDVLPSWFGVHVALEAAATSIRTYEPAVVPDLRTCRRAGPTNLPSCRGCSRPRAMPVLCWDSGCRVYLPRS